MGNLSFGGSVNGIWNFGSWHLAVLVPNGCSIFYIRTYERCTTLCLYLPRTTVYISSQGTHGICILGDINNVFVHIETDN
jgi:hypothetical protein